MRLLALTTFIAILGCGPSTGGDDDGANDGDSSTAAATDGSVTAASAESTSAPGDDTSASAESSVTNVDTGVDTGVDDDADDDDVDTGEKLDIAGGCDFEAIVDAAALGSKRPPLDCGFVTLADDVEAWRTAHQCAAQALAAQGAVKVLWEMQGTDSTLYGALVGFVGETYGISEYGYDSFGGPVMWARSCEGVVTLDDCAVGVGEMCLTCSGPGDQTALCE